MMTRDFIVKSFGEEWVDFMTPFVQSDEFTKILTRLREDKAAGAKIYPDALSVFRCFRETPLSQVRVIILGQDPYPIEGYANGLAFSHSMEKKISASLDKIIDAIEVDCYNGLNFSKDKFDTTLDSWVKQGVLLFNVALTVLDSTPGHHAELWKPFTEYFVKTMATVKRDIIWMAWGKQAQAFTEKLHFVTNFVLTEEHPTAAAREKRAWPCIHFSMANAIITGNRLGATIKW